MEAFDRPIIGAINGAATTGGLELALLCDILIASTEARFADTHARVGIIPGWGLGQKLSRIIGPYRARELHFTGNFLSAEKAEAWGLVSRVVPPAELLPTALTLAREIASCDQPTVRAHKRLINDGLGMTLNDGMAMEKQAAHDANLAVSQGSIGSLREQVIQRGRAQQTK